MINSRFSYFLKRHTEEMPQKTVQKIEVTTNEFPAAEKVEVKVEKGVKKVVKKEVAKKPRAKKKKADEE